MIEKIKKRIKERERSIIEGELAMPGIKSEIIKSILGSQILSIKDSIDDLELMLELAEKLECQQK